jgi:hypothetical protein
MAQDASKPSKGIGWFKAIFGAVAGLVSGAVMMYISPLVDSVVKPPKPLANFAVETDGLTATFHNRYAGEGWWDFGDGSPLEPASLDQASISHTYSKPGTYSSRLIVRNFIGDEHERTVSVEVTVTNTNAATPALTQFEAIPVSADRSAPASFKLVAQSKDAERLLWDLGAERPLEVATENLAKQERTITFATPGQHVVQLTALGGNQAVKRQLIIDVAPPRQDTLIARLRVSDRGNKMEQWQSTEMVPLAMQRKSGGQKIERRVAARTGAVINKAELGQVDPAFKNLKIQISADRRFATISGEAAMTQDMMKSPNHPTIAVLVTQERQMKMSAPPAEVTTALTPGSVAVLPMPTAVGEQAGVQRQMSLEIRDGGKVLWQDSLPAKSNGLYWRNQRWVVQAAAHGNDLRLQLVPSGSPVSSPNN